MKTLLVNDFEFVLILHNIRSLFNVGSIFRTADALAVKKIYLTGITPSPIDIFGRLRKDFNKVALNSLSNILWESKIRISDVFKILRKEKFKIFAVEQAKNSIYYYEYKIKKEKKIALVLGNEVKGLNKKILEKVDKILEIPMLGLKESLNVSISFSVVGYYFRFNKF